MVLAVNPSIDPLSQLLGEISAKLDTVTKTQAEDRLASAAYRTDVRKELATLSSSVTDVKNRVNNNADEIAELRPDVEDYRTRRDKGLGMADLTKTVWIVLSGLGVAGIGYIVHALWPVAK